MYLRLGSADRQRGRAALLVAWGGDEAAFQQLIPLVHRELHRIARRCLKGERPGHTLQPTALVNEAYLRLVDVRRMSWKNRTPTERGQDLVALDQALTTLSAIDERKARVDKRTDIWAFGCVLFEMLTGRAPFARQTMSDTFAAILEAEPEWQLLPSSTPPNIRRLLERCLAKDMKRRIRDIADARVELEEPVTGSSSIARTTSTRRRLAGWLAASAVVIAGAVLGWRAWPDASPRDPLAGATFKRLTDWDGAEQQVAISRDGKFVAFVSDRSGTWDAWVGEIGTDSFSNLTNGGAPDLRNHEVPNVGFTPDGSLVTIWVRLTDPANGVQTNGWTVPTIGGQLRPYRDRYAPNVAGADWSPDGRRLVFQTSNSGDPLFVHDVEHRTGRQILVSNAGVHDLLRC